eukprot:364503-Chlamydomonas_euryale.AAC.8
MRATETVPRAAVPTVPHDPHHHPIPSRCRANSSAATEWRPGGTNTHTKSPAQCCVAPCCAMSPNTVVGTLPVAASAFQRRSLQPARDLLGLLSGTQLFPALEHHAHYHYGSQAAGPKVPETSRACSGGTRNTAPLACVLEGMMCCCHGAVDMGRSALAAS